MPYTSSFALLSAVFLPPLTAMSTVKQRQAGGVDLLAMQQIAPVVNDAQVLAAMKSSKHPAAAAEREDLGDGEYQYTYSFDEEEWEAMAFSIHESNTGTTPANPLAARQFSEDDYLWICTGTGKSDDEYVYSQTLNMVTGTICLGFVLGGDKLAERQVVERYGLRNVFNQPVLVVWSYVHYVGKFGAATACSSAFSQALTNFCHRKLPGIKGEHDATSGLSVAIVDDDGDPEAGLSVTVEPYDDED